MLTAWQMQGMLSPCWDEVGAVSYTHLAENQPGQRQSPHQAQHHPPPCTAFPQDNQAHGGVGACDQKIDGGVIVFPQGNAALDRGVYAVI